jgi:hypothetical protein
MATALHADRTASEARRPEAGSRAGGVSRAERGNDGSPKGRDAAGGSMRSTTARPAISQVAGDAQPSKPINNKIRTSTRGHRGSAAAVWPIRRSRSAVQGRQACAAGIARRAFPRQAEGAGIAPRGRDARERPATPQGRVRRRPSRPAAHRAHRRSTASRRGTTGRARSAGPARRAPSPARPG